VVVHAIDVAPDGVGAYTLRCDTGNGTAGGGGSIGSGGSGAGGAAGVDASSNSDGSAG
jgi:hypothetical protein